MIQTVKRGHLFLLAGFTVAALLLHPTAGQAQSGMNLVTDGGFDNGFANYGVYNLIQDTEVQGTLAVTRSNPDDVALIGQSLQNTPVPAGTQFEVTVDLALTEFTDDIKDVRLRLWELGNESNALDCPFTVQSVTPTLLTYTLRGVTASEWANLDVQLYLFDNRDPSLLVDNLSVRVVDDGITKTECVSALVPNVNLLQNSSFNFPGTPWTFSDGLKSAVVESAEFQFPFGDYAVLSRTQYTDDSGNPFYPYMSQALENISMPAGTPLEFRGFIWNTSDEAALVSIHLWNQGDESSRRACPFTIPANSGVDFESYIMQVITPGDWENPELQFFVGNFGEEWIVVDEFNLRFQPNRTIAPLRCYSADKQGDKGLVINGDFDYGDLFFGGFGALNRSVVDGVMQLSGQNDNPAGIFQPLFKEMDSEFSRFRQDYGYRLQVRMGNTAATPKTVVVRLWEVPNDANQFFCVL